MFARARQEEGFGLVELLAAMTILSVGILAVVAAFSSGILSIQRASRISTAAALADTQLELYRGVRYDAIALDTTEVANELANGDATWEQDSAYTANPSALFTAACTPLRDECRPTRIAQGADNRNYRIDVYIVRETPAVGARELKRVTVVVRDPSALSKTFVRETSTFDRATGS